MDCIGKPVSFKYKHTTTAPVQTGTIESVVVKLDNPRYASGFGMNQEDTTHVQVGGPRDSYELISASGGKRRRFTRKSRKSPRKTRKSRQ